MLKTIFITVILGELSCIYFMKKMLKCLLILYLLQVKLLNFIQNCTLFE